MAKNNLNKNEMGHVRLRVESIVQCTNGEIATVLNRLKKGTGLTVNKKLELIKNGVASLRSDHILYEEKTGYRDTSILTTLLICYDYPETVTQESKRAFNALVERKKEELMQEVTLEGKRLIDRIVLGITALEDVPEELHKLGSMTSLARSFKSSDFQYKNMETI